jgi:hypothetical protein
MHFRSPTRQEPIMPSLLTLFTLLHVAISLVAIGSGFVVIYEMLHAKESRGWTAIFLATTVLTSMTGFGFPVDRVVPSHIVGVLSLIALGLAIYSRYSRHLARTWRPTYVVAAVISQYLDVFVLIVQSFQKIPVLHALAPTQTELPFAVAQVVTLLVFIALGVRAVTRFRRYEIFPSEMMALK